MRKPTRSATTRRSAGILLHVTSLPGPYGIGDLGPAARRWVDALARAGQTWWQTLPLGPPGAGNSPYQCYSAFAGSPMLLNPDDLVRDGLLRRSDLSGPDFPRGRVDYQRAGRFKTSLLARAWGRFRGGAARQLRVEFERFRSDSSDWLDDFALFMALRDAQGAITWTDWPKDLVLRKPAALRSAARDLSDAVGRHEFGEFLFFRQLTALREYGAGKGVRLMGDLPIYVSPESSDVWASPHLFRLDRQRRPTAVAGVPPDFFSATGQRWGNPLYNWPAMKREGFAWWVARMRAALAQSDLVRIDHFRGFAGYWSVPASEPTAVNGRWVKAPGAELFDTLRRALGGLPFIAEDLGVITPDVERLRDSLGLPGMRVLQFAFDGGADNPHLPHNYVRHGAVYTGTHDNDTTTGWFASLDRKQAAHVRRYAGDGVTRRNAAEAMIRLAWSSVADYAIAPAQDLLGLGNKARMNLPGTALGNWAWRLSDDLNADVVDRLAEVTAEYSRTAPA